MPNHVENVLTIVGTPAEIARFIKKVHAARPHSGDIADVMGKPINRTKGQGLEQFCFHALVPLPKRYSEVPYGIRPVDGGKNGYDMECETWGVKWGAYGENSKLPPVVEPGIATYKFTTAWGGCSELITKAAPKWPKLHFFLSWGGESPCRGKLWARGKTSEGQEDAYDAAEYKDEEENTDDDSDASWEFYKSVEQKRILEHPVWVGQHIAATANYDFKDSHDQLADWLEERSYPILASWIRNKHVVLERN